jgi:short-subunit dehydrogenase
MDHDNDNAKSPAGWALVTGASSGIGRALAGVLAEHGHNLVLVARSEDKLVQLGEDLARAEGVQYRVIAADLARPQAPEEVAARLSSLAAPVDVLVNNAGFGLYGPFAQGPLDAQLDMVHVNVVALTALTGLLLPSMLAGRAGRILNVASTAAFQPGPMMAVYYATKAYVLSFSEALANEVAGTGVTVTALCPGPTRSAFQATARMQSARLVRMMSLPEARSVALAGYQGLMLGRRIVIPGWTNRLGARLARLAPRTWVTAVVRRLHEPVDR